MRLSLTLFPQSILRVGRLEDLDFPLPHSSSGATVVRSDDARIWIRKRASDSAPAQLVAEGVAWLLGRHLGVPMPEGAVHVSAGEESWLSAQLEPVMGWSSSFSDRLTNCTEIGAMLTLDMLLHNEDRHAGNLLLQPNPDDLHVKAWAIDFGDSKAGYPLDLRAANLGIPSAKKHLLGLPLPLLQPGATAAASLAGELSDAEIRSLVTDPCEIAGYDAGLRDTLAGALLRRCQAASSLLPTYLANLEARG